MIVIVSDIFSGLSTPVDDSSPRETSSTVNALIESVSPPEPKGKLLARTAIRNVAGSTVSEVVVAVRLFTLKVSVSSETADKRTGRKAREVRIGPESLVPVLCAIHEMSLPIGLKI